MQLPYLDLRVEGSGAGDKGRYIVSIFDIVCMAAFISSLFTLLMTLPIKMYEVLL
jgi:hypothetical protein